MECHNCTYICTANTIQDAISTLQQLDIVRIAKYCAIKMQYWLTWQQ